MARVSRANWEGDVHQSKGKSGARETSEDGRSGVVAGCGCFEGWWREWCKVVMREIALESQAARKGAARYAATARIIVRMAGIDVSFDGKIDVSMIAIRELVRSAAGGEAQ